MQRYGLIGYPLTHSFSPAFFNEKFKQEGLNEYKYESFPMDSIDQLPGLLNKYPDLHGLNVTIPYKRAVLPFLHQFDEVVSETGSCNCIQIENGILTGYNTDVIGFEQSLMPFLETHHNHALVLGTGGASAAVCFVLKKLGIPYLSVSRNPKHDGEIAYESISESIMKQHTIIINTTPLGMYPNIDECPGIPYELMNKTFLLFDLIYNPVETLFLNKGKERGATIKNGNEMLLIQALESWNIWKIK